MSLLLFNHVFSMFYNDFLIVLLRFYYSCIIVLLGFYYSFILLYFVFYSSLVWFLFYFNCNKLLFYFDLIDYFAYFLNNICHFNNFLGKTKLNQLLRNNQSLFLKRNNILE